LKITTGSHGWLAGVAVERPTEGPDEGEVDGPRDATQLVLLWHETVERQLVVELELELALAHHGLPPQD
jgi:hypothetical protein